MTESKMHMNWEIIANEAEVYILIIQRTLANT